MKIYHLLFIFMMLNLINAQEIEIFKIDYQRNDLNLSSFAFKSNKCGKETILDVWKSLVDGNGGKSSSFNEVIGFYKSEGVEFSEIITKHGPVNVYFQLFEKGNDSLIISNAFQLIDGTFVDFNSKSQLSNQILNIVEHFSEDVNKACVIEDLNQAIEFQEQIYEKIYEVQTDQLKLEKDITRAHTRLPKIRSEENTYRNQISFYERKLQQTKDSYTQVKLNERLEETKKKHQKVLSKLQEETKSINDFKDRKIGNEMRIEELKNNLAVHQTVIEDIKNRLNDLQ